MSNILLDTNAYSRLVAADELVVREVEGANTVYISTVVLGELLEGFWGGSKRDKNLDILSEFLSKSFVEIIGIEKDTAEIYADIKYSLRKKGTPIPLNDIWIASNAIETGSKIVTFDRHFLKIPGVRLWRKL